MSTPVVLLATSWGEKRCGIAEHSKMLIAGVKAADPAIVVTAESALLDPQGWQVKDVRAPDYRRACHYLFGVDGVNILHLNYHRALHSRWTAHEVARVKESGVKVVITFHDTIGENPPDLLSQDLCAIADAFIVHEPVVGLEKAIYWRQGVPEENAGYAGEIRGWYATRPVLGTVGFDFPWKNYSWVAKLTYDLGWGYTICCPEMSEAREAELRAINPWLFICRDYETEFIIPTLRMCDATAFCYVCNNTGTSAAIRLGIAARRPVIALSTCRQFRDLLQDRLGHMSIRWATDEQGVINHLRFCGCIGRHDMQTHNLAEQESWRHLGKRYADLYRSLV